ncbi:MAG: PQQ-binding-like beta-propeller repeat protein [Paludisphaera borealis]|uniref:beta-propeller domain-containing protein n=1 Tax=Paludisphaera borealis TaxID=1387353 RepID=UPI00284B9E04|nr:PQQ-binding-like beta-propeller repeat protein [Paludisphaera borealis]MDR3620571.1 PQQ-binding-like beta-propeller repeat protein [Paludisphaera borealis]
MHARSAFHLGLVLSVLGWTAHADAQGPASRRVLGADRGRLAIVDAKGDVEWEMPLKSQVHDLQLLPNGNILTHTGAATVVEINPAKEIVWSYTSVPRSGYNGPIEVHAVQRLDDGLTMIAETGNRRIIEVNREGKIVHSVDLKVEKPDSHRDTRLVRKLANGHYLVCQELDGAVHEYAPDGAIVWSYRLDLDGRPATPGHDGHGTEVFGALRLASGNTLIATGNGNRVIEVDPAGQVVWSIGHDELPGIHLKWVTSLAELPNGHIVFGNTHAGPDNPQLIEVTRDKKVVWALRNFHTFGNDLAAAVVLDSEK